MMIVMLVMVVMVLHGSEGCSGTDTGNCGCVDSDGCASDDRDNDWKFNVGANDGSGCGGRGDGGNNI